ncbi:hypothetical protein NDU88_005389 [Pleurodeles waltl]|uniref:Uncharacterized protein n=1 Tax=Pleurodeles waltl TaxID=8319 RepID=A0AAV7WAK1_PLEWA|nr:hypothetical protein NDU88_005389 [Pleurodeles waltl]
MGETAGTATEVVAELSCLCELQINILIQATLHWRQGTAGQLVSPCVCSAGRCDIVAAFQQAVDWTDVFCAVCGSSFILLAILTLLPSAGVFLPGGFGGRSGKGRVPATKLTRKWMGEFVVEEGLSEKVSEKRVSAQNKYKGGPMKTICVKVGDYVKIKSARIVQKGESKFLCPKRVIKICKNAITLEDSNLWNKERLSLARDVELLSKTLDESTRLERETKDLLQKNSPCDMKVLSKELERSAKEECETKDMMR